MIKKGQVLEKVRVESMAAEGKCIAKVDDQVIFIPQVAPDDFRVYILGFIFYKYLSEKMHSYANAILEPDGIKYREIDEDSSRCLYEMSGP